jgi:AraC-like DNA-binding protein
MEPVIQSSHGQLALQPALPINWDGGILAGSVPYFYKGPLGELTIQKFQDKRFSICYAVANFFQKIKLFWNEQSVLRLQYALDGKLNYRERTSSFFKLKAGQINAVWAPGRQTEAHFSKGHYEIFQIAFDSELIKELVPNFPDPKSFPPETFKQWIGDERQKDIYNILNIAYNENARRFFYETKIREHLLHFLLLPPSYPRLPYSDEEKERIFAVDRKILKNLSIHYSTEELARFARMPETKLVAAFKAIVGVSMFERYKEAKLQKAKKYLLETDVQIKVLFEMVGYDSYSGFVEAFTIRFGLSPLRFRKKFRPFD